MNLKLWEQVHALELKIRIETSNHKREEKQFRKKLVRVSKYLDMAGQKPKRLRELLQDSSVQQSQVESAVEQQSLTSDDETDRADE